MNATYQLNYVRLFCIPSGIGGTETDTSGQTQGAGKTNGWGPFRNR